MTALNREPQVARLALDLGLGRGIEPVESIVTYCRRRIGGWVADAGASVEALTISELERLVCARLGLVFEPVWSDDDLTNVVSRYVQAGEPVFASLFHELNNETYATLFELHGPSARPEHRYVAVIDCRGQKAHRRYFTKWHEIAHLLTLTRQLDLPFHRATAVDQPPLERLMDVVAGATAFPEGHVRLGLSRFVGSEGLTFGAVEQIRDAHFPEASLQATLYACVTYFDRPVLCVEAGMSLKKTERRLLSSPQSRLFSPPKLTERLRVLSVVSNVAARARAFRIDAFMEVPRESLVARVFAEDSGEPPSVSWANEELSTWRHSDGRSVGSGIVSVEVRRLDEKVLALIQPPFETDE